MKALADLAIEAAISAGASYADVRLVECRGQSISTKNGEISYINESEDRGVGIRVLCGGAWGFASCGNATAESVKKTASRAVDIASASCRYKEGSVELTEEPPAQEQWKVPFKIDPFGVPLESKIDLLLEVDAIAGKVKGVMTVHASMNFKKKKQLFLRNF